MSVMSRVGGLVRFGSLTRLRDWRESKWESEQKPGECAFHVRSPFHGIVD